MPGMSLACWFVLVVAMVRVHSICEIKSREKWRALFWRPRSLWFALW